MKLWSDSFQPGARIPAEFALGAAGGFGGNRNPHLAWSDVPEATRSLALLCIDTDAPTDASLAGRADIQISIDHPRGNFVHWVVVDIPTTTTGLPAGSASAGVTPRGKPPCQGTAGARQGLNDYTGWFAGDAEMAGDYFGYDGPYPPPNDLRLHRYFFRLFALDVDTLGLPARFTAADAFRAMQGHVLAETSLQGTYSLHPGLSG